MDSLTPEQRAMFENLTHHISPISTNANIGTIPT